MSTIQFSGHLKLSVLVLFASIGAGCGQDVATGPMTFPIGGANAGGIGGIGGAGSVAGVSGVGGASGIGGAGGVSGTGGVAGDVPAGIGGIGGAGGEAGTAGVSGEGGAGGGGGVEDSSCLDGITSFDGPGPFTFQMKMSGSINMWIPDVPAGCKVPMVHLANGTNTTCSQYQPSLERLASHGFIALCYESPQTGAGTQAIEAFDAALAEHADIAAMKLGSTGHSQGGQSALCALRLAEEKWGAGATYAALAMQPASGYPPGAPCAVASWQERYVLIESPVFMYSGSMDYIVSQSWVQDGFNALNDSVEAYHWLKDGGVHLPVPNGEEMQLSIPWFRWKLLGDNDACKAFKAIRDTDPTWSEAAVQNEAPCL